MNVGVREPPRAPWGGRRQPLLSQLFLKVAYGSPSAASGGEERKSEERSLDLRGNRGEAFLLPPPRAPRCAARQLPSKLGVASNQFHWLSKRRFFVPTFFKSCSLDLQEQRVGAENAPRAPQVRGETTSQ